ncbi:TOBE domain-containing protein [Alcaligenes sp. SDU_A2]|uniref:TOBE domain-containing protein n=1 Tax=Alcaligenes sp. SDU_A2 TaxID=3136634 RepID=UPI00311D36E3
MSDRIVVMEKGRIVEQGTPTDLYLKPRRHFTAQLIGKAEVFACAAVQADGGFVAVDTPLGRIRASDPHGLGANAGYLMIRPESVEILPDSAQGENLVPAVVTHKVFVGDRTHYSFVSGQNPLTAVASAYLDLPVGRSVKLSLYLERCVLLEHDSALAA